ncbi:MAG: fimbrillin family protein [Bacteroides sp.]
MNAKALTITLSIATMVLTACGNDDAIDNWNGEIRLTSGMAAQQTRTSFGQDTQLASGQKVSVFVDKTTSAEQLYGNIELTAGTSGSFTGNSMYYPAGSNVDVYAFHPSLPTSVTAYPTTAFTHAVSSDQSKNTGYLASDLLYAASKGNAKSADAIKLTFYHMLSKVEVALKSGNGKPNLSGATVTIEGTQLKADFTAIKATNISEVNNRAGMIAVSEIENTATPITIGTEITTDDFGTSTAYAEAVIVPQTVAGDAAFIKVTLANSGPTYIYKLDAATTFASGKKYQYKITVNNSELKVTSSITDWLSGDPKAGDAEMQ